MKRADRAKRAVEKDQRRWKAAIRYEASRRQSANRKAAHASLRGLLFKLLEFLFKKGAFRRDVGKPNRFSDVFGGGVELIPLRSSSPSTAWKRWYESNCWRLRIRSTASIPLAGPWTLATATARFSAITGESLSSARARTEKESAASLSRHNLAPCNDRRRSLPKMIFAHLVPLGG